MDWLASACGLIGCFLVGQGIRYGWLLFASASAINAYLGYKAGLLGLMAGGLCYVILEIRGWLKHKKD